MPKRGERSIKALPGDLLDPHGWPRMIEGFGDWMGCHGYAERTVENRRKSMAQVATWLIDRGVTRPAEVTKPMLERYQRWLFHYRQANAKPLSFRSQNARLVPVRAFFKWAAKENRILYNPAGELELPRVERSLPKAVLTAAEAERVLAQPNLDEATGIRDRAILEVFYSTGVRRMELVNLLMFDLDVERRTLFVRQGKGRKDRMIPIGERAIVWCERYIRDVRHLWAPIPDEGVLFLTVDGTALSPGRLTSVVRDYVNRSGVGKKGSCHLFRHSMATHMLEGGADIRWIQAMLGHTDILTTQIYTKISVRQLQAVHDLTHPGARNERHRDPDTLRLLADAGIDPDHPDDDSNGGDGGDGDGGGEESAEFSLGPRLNHYAKDLVAEKQQLISRTARPQSPATRATTRSATASRNAVRRRHDRPTHPSCRAPQDATALFVTAEGLPDAWVNGDDIEVNVTGYDGPVEATIVVPLVQARAWAADLYAAVTIAHREHTGDGMTDYELATMPDPGRLIFERLAGYWTD